MICLESKLCESRVFRGWAWSYEELVYLGAGDTLGSKAGIKKSSQ